MSITLSQSDLQQLGSAIRLLASPFDHPTVDHWRSSVNQQLRELLYADTAGFLLPVAEGMAMFSEEHDPRELARYPDFPPPTMPDGTPLWEAMLAVQVDTLANMYGDDYHRYLGSAYYNEYAGANGAHDTLVAAVSMGGTDARSIASLHLWHARPDARLFGEREVALLRLLFPAFCAGVGAHLRWERQRQDLLESLDQLGHAALVCDASGRVAHASRRMEAMLQQDPEAELLRAQLHGVVRDGCRAARGEAGAGGAPPARLTREVRTLLARYRISATLFGRATGSGAPYVVASLERLTPARRTPEELREAFSLTRAEARVALLIGEGKSNAEVARELFISPHTARRHTESIFQKMEARSRSEIGARLYS